MELINGILKYSHCPHCGNEWEYQCFECEKEEEHLLSLDESDEDYIDAIWQDAWARIFDNGNKTC